MDTSYTVTSQMYKNLLPAQVLSALIHSLVGFVGSLIAGLFIDSEALAIIGFIAPVTLIVSSVTQLITAGTSTVLGRYIGRGKYQKINSVFTTIILTSIVISLILIAGIFLFTKQILSVLGVNEQLMPEAVLYFRAVALGYLPTILCSVIIVFLSMGNHVGYSALTTVIMGISNILLGLTFVLFVSKKLFVVGAAASISSYIGLSALLVKLVKNQEVARLEKHGFELSVLSAAIICGFPMFIVKLCQGLMLIIINRTAMSVAGIDAVSGISVMNSSTMFANALIEGALSTSRYLASISIGEMDKTGLKNTVRAFLRISFPLCLITDVLFIIFSVPVALAFGVSGAALHYSSLCIVFFAISKLIKVIFYEIDCVYFIIIKKIRLSVVLGILENLVLSAAVCFVGKMLSSIEVVYSSYAVSAFISMVIVIIISTVKNGHLPKEPLDLIRPIQEIENADSKIFTTTVLDLESALSVSKDVIQFCIDAGADRKKAYYTGLCIEEMSVNFISYGVKGCKKKPALDILVNVLDDGIRIRLRDNTPKFDPVARMKIAKAKDTDPFGNIGIKIVSGLAKTMEYKQNFNMNVTTIEL